MRFIFLSILFLFIGSSCKKATIFSESIAIDNTGWDYADPAIFTFDIPDATMPFAIEIDIIHDQAYAFENLYLSVSLKQPDGMIKEEVISISLVSNEGHWLGSTSSGNVKRRASILKSQILDQTGTYELTINQNSRAQNLKGISQIRCYIFNQ